MSNDLTKPISSTPDVQSAQTVSEDVALRVEEILEDKFLSDLNPQSNSDGTIEFVDGTGEVVAVLYPDESVYVCIEEFCCYVDDLEEVLCEDDGSDENALIEYLRDYYGDEIFDTTPDSKSTGSKVQDNAKKFSDTGETFIPDVYDNTEGVELKKVSELDSFDEKVDADETSTAPEETEVEMQSPETDGAGEQPLPAIPPDGAMAAAGFGSPHESVEVDLSAASFDPSDMMPTSGAIVNSSAPAKAQGAAVEVEDGKVGVSSEACVAEAFVASGAKAAFVEDEEKKKAEGVSHPFVVGISDEDAPDLEDDLEFDDEELMAANVNKGDVKFDDAKAEKKSISHEPVFVSSKSKKAKSSDPFSTGAEAMCSEDPARAVAGHAQYGGPPFLGVAVSLSGGPQDNAQHRFEIAAAHRREGEDQPDRDGGEGKKGNQQQSNNDADEQEGVSSIAFA